MSDSRRKKDRYRQTKEERKAEANAEQAAKAKNLPPRPDDPDHDLKAFTTMTKRRWVNPPSEEELELCFKKMEEMSTVPEKVQEQPQEEISKRPINWWDIPSEQNLKLMEEISFLYSKQSACMEDAKAAMDRLIDVQPMFDTEHHFNQMLKIEIQKISQKGELKMDKIENKPVVTETANNANNNISNKEENKMATEATVNTVKNETVVNNNTNKEESKMNDTVKTATSVKAEPAKVEPAKVEAVNAEPAKVEAVKPEPTKVEVKVEQKIEQPKAEQPKAEQPKADAAEKVTQIFEKAETAAKKSSPVPQTFEPAKLQRKSFRGLTTMEKITAATVGTIAVAGVAYVAWDLCGKPFFGKSAE